MSLNKSAFLALLAPLLCIAAALSDNSPLMIQDDGTIVFRSDTVMTVKSSGEISINIDELSARCQLTAGEKVIQRTRTGAAAIKCIAGVVKITDNYGNVLKISGNFVKAVARTGQEYVLDLSATGGKRIAK